MLVKNQTGGKMEDSYTDAMNEASIFQLAFVTTSPLEEQINLISFQISNKQMINDDYD